ncbi:MAG: HmuY family protein, partial [Flavobacteriales bacterium]
PAPPTITGDYTKFSFSSGSVVVGDDWDVAFRSTSIIVNGGVASDTLQPTRSGNAAVYMIDGIMDDIITVDTSLLLQDGVTSTAIVDDFGQMQMGWCVYDQMTNIISPIAGKILVFRTHDNKYAKIEILNFYDAAMSNPYGGFYTFNYVYQPNENTLNF